jgi:hypothetical protein
VCRAAGRLRRPSTDFRCQVGHLRGHWCNWGGGAAAKRGELRFPSSPGGTAPVSRFRGRLLLGIHFWDPFGTASRETAPGAAHGAVPNGPKVFFWLLLKDRLNTCNLLLRKNKILPSYNCVLCQL